MIINTKTEAGRRLLVAAYLLWANDYRAGLCISTEESLARPAEQAAQEDAQEDADALERYLLRAVEQDTTLETAVLAVPVSRNEITTAFSQWAHAERQGWRAPILAGLTTEQAAEQATITLLGYVASARTLNLHMELGPLLEDSAFPTEHLPDSQTEKKDPVPDNGGPADDLLG